MDMNSLPAGLTELKETVATAFGDILKENGFQIVYQEARSSEHCLLEAASPVCGIRFVSDMGFLEVLVGGPHAGRPNGQDKATKWFAIWPVMDFVEGKPKPSLAALRNLSKDFRTKSPQETADLIARRLRPIARDLFGLFARETAPAKRQALETYYSDNSYLRGELGAGSRRG